MSALGAAFVLAVLSAPQAWAQEGGKSFGPPAPAAEVAAGDLATPPGIDETLAQAARAMMATFPSLEAARRNLRAAGYEADAAHWLRFPRITASIETRNDSFDLRPDILVFQPLWSGGRISAAGERSRAARDVATATYGEVSFALLERLALTYYEIGRTARLVAIYEDSVAEHRRLVESMERRVQQEVSPRTDLELALTRTAQAEQELAMLRTQLAIARRRFTELSGLDAAALAPPVYDPVAHHAVSEAMIDQAGACNPTFRRFNALVSLAEADRKASRAKIMPEVGAQYVRDRFGGDQVGVAVRAQTDGGLSAFALAEAAAARRDASQFDALTAQRQLREAVALSLIENSNARARIESSARSADASLNVARSFLRQFVAGRRTWLDVMNSVREAVAARSALIEAETSAMSSSALIHLRACAWLPGDPEGSAQ